MDNTTISGTISGECRSIRQQLTDLLTVLRNGSAQVSTTVDAPSIQDALERFMLWAGNLGALRKPTSKLSLDARLASSQDVRLYVGRELQKISKALEDLMNIVDGSRPNRELGYSSDSEDDQELGYSSGSEKDSDMGSHDSSSSHAPKYEAGSLLQVISQGITSLLKIGILVRQPAASGVDRFHRATRDTASTFLDRFDIDYVEHRYPKLHLTSSDRSSRMGKAIAKRRQFIRYCRDHKSNLAAAEEKDSANPQVPLGSQKATTAKQSSKATTFVPKGNLMDILQGLVEEDDDGASQWSASTTSELLAVLKLPPLASLPPLEVSVLPEQKTIVECPICCTHQQFRSEQAWRRHAFRDLKAYVCTVGGAECDDKFFDDRTSWFNHELEQHRSSYVCVLCGVSDGQKDRTRSLLSQHILDVHGEFEPDQLERLEEAGRDMTNSFKTSDCPFCDEWSALVAKRKSPGGIAQSEDNFIVSTSRFKKHVAMHLEQLAIFALPRHELDTGKDEDGSYGSESRVMHSDDSAWYPGLFRSENQPTHSIEDDQSDRAPSEDDGSIVHATSETEHLPTTSPEEEVDRRIEGLKQRLSLLGELNPKGEHMKEEEKNSQAESEGIDHNHSLQDYQIQLILLEQQNKKKLMMARQKQDEENRKKAGINDISQRKEKEDGERDGVKDDDEDGEEWDEEEEWGKAEGEEEEQD